MPSKDFIFEASAISSFTRQGGVCIDFLACIRARKHRSREKVGGQIGNSSPIVSSDVERVNQCSAVDMARMDSVDCAKGRD